MFTCFCWAGHYPRITIKIQFLQCYHKIYDKKFKQKFNILYANKSKKGFIELFKFWHGWCSDIPILYVCFKCLNDLYSTKHSKTMSGFPYHLTVNTFMLSYKISILNLTFYPSMRVLEFFYHGFHKNIWQNNCFQH